MRVKSKDVPHLKKNHIQRSASSALNILIWVIRLSVILLVVP